MINFDLTEKNKNNLVNLGVIILASVIAFNLFIDNNKKINSLSQQQNNELERNKIVENIATLEKKEESYKKFFVKKDLASIMDVVSDIAKDSSIVVVSVKPLNEEGLGRHLISPFLITLNAPTYDALGDFISKIENYKGVFLISEIDIVSNVSSLADEKTNQDEDALRMRRRGAVKKSGLNVNLQINTIAYL